MIAALIVAFVLAVDLAIVAARWWLERRQRPRIVHRQLAQVIEFPRREDRVRFVSRRRG